MYKHEVSIIVPIYNGERYIDFLVEQFSRQTINEFIVIFVNDGSTDGTLHKLQSLDQTKLKFDFSIISQSNGGVSAARNAGLKIAQSNYVCFIDVDDRIPNDFLEVLYHSCTNNYCEVAMGQICKDIRNIKTQKIREVTIKNKIEILNEYLFSNVRYSICASMFSLSCFNKNKLKFPEGYKYSEDVFVLWQILANTDQVALIKEAIYFYYDNPFSAMHKNLDLERWQAVALMKMLEPIILKNAPDFSENFSKYAVARHYWSILWQAAKEYSNFKDFKHFCSNFAMHEEMLKLNDYPDWRIVFTAKTYCLSPQVYYCSMHLYTTFRNYLRSRKNK